MEKQLFVRIDQYINALLASEDKALTRTIESLDRNEIPQISISAGQGKLLQVFARICNARRILEVGTLGGYSSIWLARTLPEGGRLVSLEIDPHHAMVAIENIKIAGLSDKVEIRTGKAIDILEDMIARKEDPFDLIFIDADKPPYTEYFDFAVKLSRMGSIIICDNVIREGEVLNENTADEKVKGVQRFNKMLSTDSRVTAIIMQQVGIKGHDGMAIAVVN
ncbi:MAG: O-methyltransferase [Bacteroidetes bacterium]|nr:O-methyltransferase [Bacteroidota bacterium]